MLIVLAPTVSAGAWNATYYQGISGVVIGPSGIAVNGVNLLTFPPTAVDVSRHDFTSVTSSCYAVPAADWYHTTFSGQVNGDVEHYGTASGGDFVWNMAGFTFVSTGDPAGDSKETGVHPLNFGVSGYLNGVQVNGVTFVLGIQSIITSTPGLIVNNGLWAQIQNSVYHTPDVTISGVTGYYQGAGTIVGAYGDPGGGTC